MEGVRVEQKVQMEVWSSLQKGSVPRWDLPSPDTARITL